MAPSSCDIVGGENSNHRATIPVFEVKRKSKKGETLQLSLTDIAPLFALHISEAAQKLGISLTSLKKACRHVALYRWPGRKVRGLKNTIAGLKRTMVRLGANSREFEVASTRAGKLQQELDELCHGTPAQIIEKMHSLALITKNAYKRLNSKHGWRSELHNRSRRVINKGIRQNLTSGNALASAPSARENSTGVNWAAKAKEPKPELAPYIDDDSLAFQATPSAHKESPCPSPGRKYLRPSPRRSLQSSSRLGYRETELMASDLDGSLPEVEDIFKVDERELPEIVVQGQNGSIMLTPKTEIGEEGTPDRKGATEDAAIAAERNTKPPETELRCPECGKSMTGEGSIKFCETEWCFGFLNLVF